MDETDTQAGNDLGRSAALLEKWGWIMFECGIENLTVKGKPMWPLGSRCEDSVQSLVNVGLNVLQGAVSLEPSFTTPLE